MPNQVRPSCRRSSARQAHSSTRRILCGRTTPSPATATCATTTGRWPAITRKPGPTTSGPGSASTTAFRSCSSSWSTSCRSGRFLDFEPRFVDLPPAVVDQYRPALQTPQQRSGDRRPQTGGAVDPDVAAGGQLVDPGAEVVPGDVHRSREVPLAPLVEAPHVDDRDRPSGGQRRGEVGEGAYRIAGGAEDTGRVRLSGHERGDGLDADATEHRARRGQRPFVGPDEADRRPPGHDPADVGGQGGEALDVDRPGKVP